MYRIYNKSKAIRSIQKYLMAVGNPAFTVVPNGIYDENTRLSVIDFQNNMSIEPSGIVDYTTFTLLYNEYLLFCKIKKFRDKVGMMKNLPYLPGDINDEIRNFNLLAEKLLNYYGFTHRLRLGNYYSEETRRAVNILRAIYLLEPSAMIDEILLSRMLDDVASIERFDKIKNT